MRGGRTTEGGLETHDSGQVSLLVLGYVAIALVLVLVVTTASSVHLERKRLLSLADGAASDAADTLDEGTYYRDGGQTLTRGVPLTDDGVRRSVEDHLRRAGAGTRVTGVAVGARTGTPDGRTAEVHLVAPVRLPLVGLGASEVLAGDVLVLSVSARARAQVVLPPG